MHPDTKSEHIIWINFIVCAWLLIVPFALPHVSNIDVKWNEAIAAVLIAACSLKAWHGRGHPRLYDAAVLLIGVWLTASPFFLNYPQTRSAADALLGSLVIVAAIVELIPVEAHELT
jgi:hypothetical protein